MDERSVALGFLPVTVMVLAVEVLGLRVSVPSYVAVRLCVPTTKSADLKEAMPVALTTSTVAMALAPS